MVMTPKEKKAFVARMKKGKKDAAKGKTKSKTYEQKFAEWQKKRPKKEKIAMKKYEQGQKRFHIKTIKKYKKYHGKSKPQNPAYVYMLDSKNNLRGVLKSEVKKYNLGKK